MEKFPRVVDSTQKIRAIERAIAWERAAPARAAQEVVEKQAQARAAEDEKRRIQSLPNGHPDQWMRAMYPDTVY